MNFNQGSHGDHPFHQNMPPLCRQAVAPKVPRPHTLGRKDICEKGFVQIIIPRDIDSIASGAFMRCDQAVVVELPDSVDYIGRHAFMGCMFLERINMSNSLRIIETLKNHQKPQATAALQSFAQPLLLQVLLLSTPL